MLKLITEWWTGYSLVVCAVGGNGEWQLCGVMFLAAVRTGFCHTGYVLLLPHAVVLSSNSPYYLCKYAGE